MTVRELSVLSLSCAVKWGHTLSTLDASSNVLRVWPHFTAQLRLKTAEVKISVSRLKNRRFTQANKFDLEKCC